jgi:hypothetical protein
MFSRTRRFTPVKGSIPHSSAAAGTATPRLGCSNMGTLEEYQRYAAECRHLAKRVVSKEHKAVLEEMANVWLRLAEEAGKSGRGSQ